MNYPLRTALRPAAFVAAQLLIVACSGSTETSPPVDGGGSHSSGASSAKSGGSSSQTGQSSSNASSVASSSGPGSTGMTSVASTGGSKSSASACNMLAPGSTVHGACAQGAEPTFTGGTIANGTYDLSALTIYPPGDAGAECREVTSELSAQGAISIQGNQVQLVIEVVAGPKTTTTSANGTFTVSGNELTTTDTCGGTGAGAPIQFTAAGNTVTIAEGGGSGIPATVTFTKM